MLVVGIIIVLVVIVLYFLYHGHSDVKPEEQPADPDDEVIYHPETGEKLSYDEVIKENPPVEADDAPYYDVEKVAEAVHNNFTDEMKEALTLQVVRIILNIQGVYLMQHPETQDSDEKIDFIISAAKTTGLELEKDEVATVLAAEEEYLNSRS